MIPHDLPDYVERGGRQVWRPPYRARRAQIFGFVLDAEGAAVDVLLHRDLIEPAGGEVDYRCAQQSVVVTFTAIEQLASAEPPDSLRGHLPELEVAVWCLAGDAIAGGRLVWYLPYVFTDSGQTVATGREVYGYPKQIGYFASDYPGALEAGGSTVVEALAIDPFDADQPAIRRPMISVDRASGTQGVGRLAAGGSALADLTGHFAVDLDVSAKIPHGPKPPPSAVITPTTAPAPQASARGGPWIVKRVLDSLQGRGLTGDPNELVLGMVANPTLVFLKQFRDVACPTKACYQAIVEAPLSVDPVGASYESLDPAMFEVSIEDWASHPIASDLGISPSTPIAPKLAFRAELNFEVQLGDEVWRAPT